MELRQFLKIILRYRYMIILMCVSATVTATCLTYALSEKYNSSTSILIRPRKSIDLVPKREEILGFPVSYYTPIETASKTYTEIIKSRIISEKIVARLSLDTFVQEEGSGIRYYIMKVVNKSKELMVKSWTLLKYGYIEEQDAFSYAVGQVQKGLTVTPTKETYLFELKAETKSPESASAVANAAAEVFMEYLQELNSVEQVKAQGLSQDKVDLAQRQLEAARKAIVEFKEKNGIVALKEETALQLKSLLDLENNIESVKRETKGALARKEELARQFGQLDVFSKSSEKVTDNPIVQELRMQLAEKEIAMVGMRSRYTAEDRNVQTLDAEITEIKKKLKQQPATVSSEVVSAVNPLYQKILIEQAELETLLKSLEAKSNALSLAISEKRKLIEQQPQKEARLASLELAMMLEEQKYILVSRELQELEIATDRDFPDIRLIHRAIAPLYPSRPIKVYHAGLAALLSLVAGIGVALLKENINVTVRSVREAEELFSLPVLMTVPRLATGRKTPWLLMEQGRKELPEVNRRHERTYVQAAVKIKLEKEAAPVRGRLVDISLGGACLLVEEMSDISPQDTIDIEIDVAKSSGKKIVFKGVVLRCKKPAEWECRSTIAAEFVDVNEELGEEINMLVKDRPADSPLLLPAEYREPIRGLRGDVQSCSKTEVSSFLITSCGQQEGKSTIAANLALSLIGTDKTTVLIDANLRHPSLHEMFDLPNETGLSKFLSWGRDLSPNKVSSGLSVITSGPCVKDPAALLGSEAMHKLIASLKQDFEFVLLDAPALLAFPDSELLASVVDTVVMILDAEKTSIEDSKRAKQTLEKTGARILGMVMNNYDSTFASYYSFCGKYSKA